MSKSIKLFGTDGIRGTANTEPMTPDLVLRVGQALGKILKAKKLNHSTDKRMVLIGKDTRLSGYMLEQALSSGLNSMGVFVQLTGPLPTPGIGFLARNMRADAGVIISASHNAFHDNGIKIFSTDGFKISRQMEQEIESLVEENDFSKHLSDSDNIGRARRIDDAAGRYIVFAKNTFPIDLSLEGVRIVLDCANGAAYKVAPAIFEELGAEVIVLGNRPNGFNINDKVGALYPEKVCEAVKTYRADVGISLDGDADRVIMTDETGQVVNGDHILAICALHMSEEGILPENTVVATQMSNLGLEIALRDHGISVIRTDVGDKYVVEEMRKGGFSLGGEQSGHIIHLDHSTTGDGCVAALSVLAVMKSKGRKLSELKQIFNEIPQVLINKKVKRKPPLDALSDYQRVLKSVNKRLGADGRTFVRYSGTEPLVRVLVEGKDKRLIGKCAEDLASSITSGIDEFVKG